VEEITEAELYRRCDEVLRPYFHSQAFKRGESGEYLRSTQSGNDRILVSRGPGSKGKTHFAVGMSYEPDYLKPVYDLVPLEGEDRGFLCGPYLNPAGVTARPKYWSYKDAASLERSLRHVLQCLEQLGVPWLKSLRDPKVLADNADPVAALPAGLANEIAGNVERAKALYQEMLRRYRLILQSATDECELLQTIGKPFVFVTAKLGVEPEKREWFEEKLNFHPQIKPLLISKN